MGSISRTFEQLRALLAETPGDGEALSDLDRIFTAEGRQSDLVAAKLHPTDATETAIKVVDPSDFTYLLINAVQEQQKVIQRQEARISALEQGKAPLASSMMSLGGVETGLAIGLLPGWACRRREAAEETDNVSRLQRSFTYVAVRGWLT